MPLPKLSSSISFYKRRLWLYNMVSKLARRNSRTYKNNYSTFQQHSKVCIHLWVSQTAECQNDHEGDTDCDGDDIPLARQVQDLNTRRDTSHTEQQVTESSVHKK